ncbi:MAG: methionyl-tRNA formyltransferase [Candidatus Marinimicrobia bacterium]|nr:methionyl-tRNA formyltransferase [Candidatus Neomarinimicrobiota bacterium]
MNTDLSLKIIFMGTPDFAVPTLEMLQASRHHIQAVVTIPDKQQGRGQRFRASAVKQAAVALGLPLLQPVNLRAPEFADELKQLAPDIIVVVAFQILPEDVFSIPRLGSFNLHASLLPRYRGAAPIHWALLNGDSESGVTTFFLKRKVDTGNIILQRSLPIATEDDLHSLYAKLCAIGADLVLDTVDQISSGIVKESTQDNMLATPAPKVTAGTQTLNFEQSAEQCHNRVRAFAPSPGAFTYRNGARLKILLTHVGEASGIPGQVVEVSADSFTIACKQGSLVIRSVQPESKKPMEAAAYLRGNPLTIGDEIG